MKTTHKNLLTCFSGLLIAIGYTSAQAATNTADVVVYGSTPGGFCAAIAAARTGASVQLIELAGCLGGVWTAGLLSWIIDSKDKPGIMQEITDESRAGHALMVCATHGPRGLRQSLFGTDILKLVRKVEIATLVVQENSPTNNRFPIIVLPVAGHDSIDQLMDSVCLMAKAFGSEVHIYQLMRPGESPSDNLLKNKTRMIHRLSDEGIAFQEVNEPSSGFSVGFSGATIEYAERVGAGCIAMMSVASDDYRYIADAEKERFLTNEPGIPILCAH